MTGYEILAERLKQARATFERGRSYEVWVNNNAEIRVVWEGHTTNTHGMTLAGVFTASIGLQDLIEAALFAIAEGVTA